MATATYTPIATQTLGSAAASITFSSIPGTYTDLRLVLTCTTSAQDEIAIQFNADTATHYSATSLGGTGVTAVSSNATTQSNIEINFTGATNTTGPALFTVDAFSYAGGTNKTVVASVANDGNGSGSVELTVGLWRSTSAITSIKVFLVNANNFNTGTIATIWGI